MLSLVITTVERTALELNSVTQVTIPTKEGEITVLPNHVPLIVPLGTGELIVYYEGEATKDYGTSPISVFIDGGVLQVANNKVELLTSLAEQAHEMDEAKIKEAKRKAEQLLTERPIDVDLAKIEAELQRELMRLKLVNKLKKR